MTLARSLTSRCLSGASLLLPLLVAACGGGGGGGGTDGPRQPIDIGAGEIGTVVGSGNRATDQVDANADGVVDAPIDALEANLDTPLDVAFDANGRMFVLDWNGHKIRALTEDGKLEFIAGTGKEGDACEHGADGAFCPSTEAEVNHPTDLAFDAEGRVIISAWHNAKIKRVDLTTGMLENVCGTGARKYEGDGMTCRSAEGADQVSFDLPSSVVFDTAGNLFIADQANQIIRRLGAVDGIVKTVAGGCPGTTGFGCPAGRGYSGDGGPATQAQLANNLGQGTDPQGKITFDAEGNLYIADTGNSVVRKVTPGADGIIGDGDPLEETITTVAGTAQPGYSGDGGPATEAMLSSPTDVVVAADGTLYIADRGNSCVRRVSPDGVISTAAGRCGVPGFEGEGGPATDAALRSPYGVALDAAGDLYVADTWNQCIRKVVLSK